MNRKSRFSLLIVMIVLQFFINRYITVMKLNIDLLFLVLIYVSVKSTFLKSILTATTIGLFTDFFSGNVLGVFGFSRTLAAFIIHESSAYLDLRKKTFLFLLISLSLAFSNLVANLFFSFIQNYEISLEFILYPPLITGILGVLMTGPRAMKRYLDVY